MKSMFSAKFLKYTRNGIQVFKKNTFSDKQVVTPQNQTQRTYEEEVIFYENEFKKAFTKFKDSQLKIYEEEIGEDRAKNVDLMLKEIISLSLDERLLFTHYLSQMNEKFLGYNPNSVNQSWPQYESKTVRFWPPENPDWGKTSLNIGGQSSTANAAEAPKSDKAAQPEKEKKEKEPEKKKQVCDIRLTSYDASKKLVLIKEIRELLKLGLKESKETVEKCPIVIMTNSRMEEAEKIKEKFKDLAVIDLI